MTGIRLADKDRSMANMSVCGKPGAGKTSFVVDMAHMLISTYGDGIVVDIISDEDILMWENFCKLHTTAHVYRTRTALQQAYVEMTQQYYEINDIGGFISYNETCEDGQEKVRHVVIYDCYCEPQFDNVWIDMFDRWHHMAHTAEYYLILVSNQPEVNGMFPRRAHIHKEFNGDMYATIDGAFIGNGSMHKFTGNKKRFYTEKK